MPNVVGVDDVYSATDYTTAAHIRPKLTPPAQQAPPAPATHPSGVRPPPAPPPPPSRAYKIGEYTSLTGDPGQGAVPPGEYNVLESLMGQWESLVGYSMEATTAELLAMANKGVQTLRDFGQYMFEQMQPTAAAGAGANPLDAMPWANYGLTKDEYASAASIFGTEYKKVTGQDISPDALHEAFQNPRDPTGGLLSGSQYQQQLMNDASVQKQFGWVKYGMDFSAWTQQKVSLRSAYGRDINDAEADTILQYHKATSGSNMGAVGRQLGQQVQAPAAQGVAGSLAR